ncbi:hypothetical protein BD311DRAFT_778406 [Dichomitus squalens]|uniref:Uncharacterized protein n=1 Tax=Dichomitus squalens TaxID=114155 RepID=A0A4Q9MQ88_9APHY|nr:hypothetical protein BD311DRAFT_778406 [Dichomitus squalens]TBU57154.1 hypothetical protein BD310DRAFT_949651 [Dichomitus squalens]
MMQTARSKPDAHLQQQPRMFLKDFDTPAEHHRWSELVPPRTALTFAAIWDEDEGMVTFSGAHLFDSETAEKGRRDQLANDSPSDVAFGDGESQVLTINDRFAIAISESPARPGHALPSAGIDSLAFARDAMIDGETVMDSRSCLGAGGLRVPPGIHYAPDSPAVASSMALASLANVPFRRRTLINNPFSRTRRDSQRARRAELRVQTNGDEVRHCDAQSARSDVTDEGFFEDRRLTTGTLGTAPVLVEFNLSSAFSVTTTSTSRYVEVDHPSQAETYSCEHRSQRTQVHRQSQPPLVKEKAESVGESAWSTLRDAERNICFNVPLEIGRRLKKQRSPRRSSSPPASPEEVLARQYYNHFPSPSSVDSDMSTWSGMHGRQGCGPNIPRPSTPKGSMKLGKSLLHRVVSCKKHDGMDDRWVYVEVEHKVKQRVCAVCV